MTASKAGRIVLVFLSFLVSKTSIPAAAQSPQISPQAPRRIVAPIDETVRTTIAGSRHPLAVAANDVGPLDGSTPLERMILVIRASDEQEYQARTLLDRQQTRGSSDYHHWLTPDEYGLRFGPSKEDLAQVSSWLTQHGFSIGKMAKSGRWIEFSGTSAQVEAAFQTRMRQYVVQGEVHVANATEISIPAAFSPVVAGLVSLHNFHNQPATTQVAKAAAAVTSNGKRLKLSTSGGTHFLTPGDVAVIYDLNPLYNGTTAVGTITGAGQIIAIPSTVDINLSDVATFQTVFGLPQNAPNIILNGPDPGILTSDITVQYAGAIRRGCGCFQRSFGSNS